MLVPEFETNLFSRKDSEFEQGSGLSDTEIGLRLHYQVNRQYSPYIGFEWKKSYGETADFHRDDGEDDGDFQWLIGLSTWL